MKAVSSLHGGIERERATSLQTPPQNEFGSSPTVDHNVLNGDHRDTLAAES